MKTSLKLWILALSLLTMAGTIYTSNVMADTTSTVKVELVGWTNSCTLGDYDWWTLSASIADIPLSWIDQTMHCNLLHASGATITLQLEDLVWANTSAVIASWNFEVSLWATSHTWSLEDAVATSALSLWTIRDAYAKGENRVWELERTVTISWSINAWQQVDKYQGTLHLFVPNSWS